MIVDEEKVCVALAYLNDDPHPVALAKKETVDAENKCKELFARAFLASNGGAENRKAVAAVDAAYVSARVEESQAILNLERARARVKAAEMLIEVWRSENANVRAAERIR